MRSGSEPPVTAYVLTLLAADPAVDTPSLLLTYGPLGFIAAGSALGLRVVWKRFDQLLVAATARAEAAEARNDVLVSRLMDQAAASLPLLTRVADQLDRATREQQQQR